MFIDELEKRGVDVKHLACEFLVKKYGGIANIQYCKVMREEKEDDGTRIYYISELDSNGGNIYGVVTTAHAFNDFEYANNNDKQFAEHFFDEVWIDMVYQELLKVAPNLAKDYLRKLEIFLHAYKTEREDEIVAQYKRECEEAKARHDEAMRTVYTNIDKFNHYFPEKSANSDPMANE